MEPKIISGNVNLNEQYAYLHLIVLTPDGIKLPLQVHVKADDEGIIVDLWEGSLNDVLGTIGLTYAEIMKD